MATVRYMVKDVSESCGFYVKHFGFEVEAQYGEGVAIRSTFFSGKTDA